MEKRKILIIDDEQVMQRLLKNLLEKEGFDTATASNGQEGLDILQKHNFDLIILDILMPVMDGFSFYKELKLGAITQHIPVLVMTVRTKMEDSFMALGVNAFLSKPVNSEKLLSEIKGILNHVEDFSPAAVTTFEKEEPTPAQEQSQEVSQVKLEKHEARNILVAGSNETVTKFMAENLTLQGCSVKVVMTGKDVISQTLCWKPELVLLEVNMDAVSANEIIDAIKQNDTVHTQILLYSYFITQEREKTSIVNAYYSNQFEHEPHPDSHENQPVYYFGPFHKDSFIHKIKRFISFSF